MTHPQTQDMYKLDMGGCVYFCIDSHKCMWLFFSFFFFDQREFFLFSFLYS